jgi:GT2 family glycosyltransferase
VSGASGGRGTAIVVTWNAADVLPACLDSLLSQELAGGLEVIVVDNASTDGTAEVLGGYTDRVRVIANDRNAGFPAANNQAAAEADGDVLFFLNPDTELPGRDTLARLTGALDATGAALAGPKLLNPDGSLQASCAPHPTVARALLVATGAAHLLPDALRARLAPDMWSHDAARDVDWVMGAALAVRADAFRELGGFWPRMYGEDQDLAFRAQERGLRVRFEPAASVVHLANHSGRRRWSDAQRAQRVAAAELMFLRTHYRRPRAAAIRAIVGSGYALRSLGHRLRGRAERARVYRAMAVVYVRGPGD